MNKSHKGFAKYNSISGFAHMLLLVIVVVAIGAGGWWMWKNDKLNIAVESPTPTPTTTRNTQNHEITGNWKSYTNEEYKFSFKYPENFTFEERKIDTQPFIQILLNKDQPNQKDSMTITAASEYAPNDPVYYQDRDKNGTVELDNQTWNRYYLPDGVGDAGSKSPPILALRREHNSILYTITFSDQEEINPTQKQILSTFEFIDESPETRTNSQEADIISTTAWVDHDLSEFSLKLPSQASIQESNCTDDLVKYENCYLITNHDENLLSPPQITIKTKSYNGGSRRVESGLSESDISYSYTEKIFGDQRVLEAVVNCETNNCTRLRNIVFVNGTQLFFVTDGVYKQKDGTTSLESPITNTIISTIN